MTSQASLDAAYPSLAGKTAIVTGGASGIGECIVRSLHGQGTNVAFLDLDGTAGAALARELDGKDARAVFVRCDLTDIPALQKAFADILDEIGPAQILVNNAANDLRENFEDITPESFGRMMDVNLRHFFFASQAVIPQMRKLGGGSIINMSSGAAVAGGGDMPTYSTAKAAILGLTHSLARKVGPEDNIRVNAVLPGAVRTAKQMRMWQTEQSQAAIVAMQCIRRDLLPEDIAQTVLFLASDQSAMITRQMIAVNGGLR